MSYRDVCGDEHEWDCSDDSYCTVCGMNQRDWEQIKELKATCQALEAERDALRNTYDKLAKGCPTCIEGKHERILIDDDGCSVSDKAKRWGHALDDYHWFCDEAGAIARNDKLVATQTSAFQYLDDVHGTLVNTQRVGGNVPSDLEDMEGGIEEAIEMCASLLDDLTPQQELNHFIPCGECGEPIDMRDLTQVAYHEDHLPVPVLEDVRGFYVLVPCDFCKETGRVPGPRPDRNGEVFDCPICRGTKTVRKTCTLEELRMLILSPPKETP